MNQQPTAPEPIDYADIDMSLLIEDWKNASKYVRNYSSDFPSLDKLVDAIPLNNAKDAPYVGDTTLAGLVRQIPRDSLQQLPVFAAKINGTKNSVEAIVGSYILRRAVFNQDTFGKGLLSTLQIGAEQALAHGYAPFMTATGQMFDEFGTTMRVLHYSDCAPEPGIQDANESGFHYVVANLTKTRVRKILAAAKSNPNTSWNIKALERLLEAMPSTPNYSIYEGSDPTKKKSTENAPTYQFITKYEVGRDGQFITFCPQIEDEPLRVLNNRSKFGYPRVQYLVIDPAALHPFGVSRVRLAAPSQNLNNAYYVNIASMLLLNSKPPIFKRGRFLKPIQLKQGNLWETNDPNAKAELVTMDNGALQSFTTITEAMVNQINTMMGKPSKRSPGNTAPGVKQQIKFEDSSINQVTNILENFLRQYALVALDTYIAEQSGESTLILDDEAKDAINRIKPMAVGDDNKMLLNWDDYYRGPVNPVTGEREGGIENLSVEIELSIGKDEMEEKSRADMQDMLTVMTQNLPDPSDPNYAAARAKVTEIEDRLLEKTIPESKRIEAPQPVEQTMPDQTTINQ